MSMTVRKSSPLVVRPAPDQEPATSRGTIKLSSFDKGLYKVSARTLLAFEDPIPNAAETIRGALSRALVHYYPFAGRIVAGDDNGDDVYIRCRGDGVAFVAASSTDLAVKEVICLDRSPAKARKLVDDLAAYYPADMPCGGPSAPLLLVQVTEFSCGGFVLGVTWNHGVADGAGMAQFLLAVGELTTGTSSPPPSVVDPVRWDDSLPNLPPCVLQAQEHLLNMDPLNDLAVLDITVPLRSVNRIRADFSSSSRLNGRPCTTFEAVVAVLWQCRTRAIWLDRETQILLVFLASVRRHVGAKRGYYGNCTVEQLVLTTNRAVADADVVDVVDMIRRAKEQISARLKENAVEVMMSEQELSDLHTYNTLTATLWRNLGFDEVDFGSGRPAVLRARHAAVAGCGGLLVQRGRWGQCSVGLGL